MSYDPLRPFHFAAICLGELKSWWNSGFFDLYTFALELTVNLTRIWLEVWCLTIACPLPWKWRKKTWKSLRWSDCKVTRKLTGGFTWIDQWLDLKLDWEVHWSLTVTWVGKWRKVHCLSSACPLRMNWLRKSENKSLKSDLENDQWLVLTSIGIWTEKSIEVWPVWLGKCW